MIDISYTIAQMYFSKIEIIRRIKMKLNLNNIYQSTIHIIVLQ